MHSIAERYDQHRYRQPSPCPLGLSEIARNGNVAPMSDSSVLSLLRERAGLQPDDAAFTYIDYEQDWAGITETLTWSEVFRRTRIVAHEVRRHCTTGDRAVILAPQGLAYIAAFLGSMQAGAIAVPLSVPQIGSHDERVSAVLADASPSVILTTSAVAEAVAEHIHRPNTNNVGPRSASGCDARRSGYGSKAASRPRSCSRPTAVRPTRATGKVETTNGEPSWCDAGGNGDP